MADKKAASGLHKATYASDKRNGGYLVRIEGLREGAKPNAFAGRDVPVVTKDGREHVETLDRLLWSGNDEESGKPIALYSFKAKPKEKVDVDF